MNHIMIKLSNVFLPVYQVKSTKAFFVIILEFSLVLFPVLLQIVKICIIKSMIKWDWLFIINNTLTRKCIIHPLTFISQFSVWIIQIPKTIHSSLVPISLVYTAISILELSFSVAQAVYFLSYIDAGIVILLCNDIRLNCFCFQPHLLLRIKRGDIFFSSFIISSFIFQLIWINI